MNAAIRPGILASSAYLPRWRIAHAVIAEAIGWSRGRGHGGSGARRFGNWDEDALTMAVEAARGVLSGEDVNVSRLCFASTTAPFADRSNAGIIREASLLGDSIGLQDLGGSRRAATSGLIEALGGAKTTLLCAADCEETRPGSEAEPETGHGAAALVIGVGDPLATLLASASLHQDFVDRYRVAGHPWEYRLEGRWARDAGTRRQVAGLAASVLRQAGLEAGAIDWFCFPAPKSVSSAVVRDCGLTAAQTLDGFIHENGLTGCAQPLLMLNEVLAAAHPGQHILLVGAGQGFDLLLLRVEAAIETRRPEAASSNTRDEDNYTRFLGLRRMLDIDGGLRSERENRSSQSAAFRHHAALNGFLGGRCGDCGQLQFPLAATCVHCHSRDTQQAESLAGLTGEVNSFTEDWLAWSPRPPLIFGNVHFPGGANVMMEFTDFEAGELATGTSVRMAFRIKDFDERRGTRRYFWKPAPLGQADG